MSLDLQARAQYLSLALFCRNVLDALVAYADRDVDENLEASLQEALDSLTGAASGDMHRLAQRPSAAFGSYEHIRTLEEVWDEGERAEADRAIKELLRGARKKEDAAKLIQLFLKLETQAL